MGFLISFLGFKFFVWFYKLLYLFVPFFSSVAGSIGDGERKRNIFIACGTALVIAFLIDIGLDNYKKNLVRKKIEEIRREYKPGFLLIEEDLYDKHKSSINWVHNDTALLAVTFYSEAIEALKLKNITKARKYFKDSVEKCKKLEGEPFNEIRAASSNNLIIVEYVDPLYEKLKEDKLNEMYNYAKNALKHNPNNAIIKTNLKHVKLHLALYSVLGR